MTEKQLEQCWKYQEILEEMLETYSGRPVNLLFIMDEVVKELEKYKGMGYITCAMWLWIGGMICEMLHERNFKEIEFQEL